MSATLAAGFALGFLARHLLGYWHLMFRACCRDHYATHATCPCRDCAADREARS